MYPLPISKWAHLLKSGKVLQDPLQEWVINFGQYRFLNSSQISHDFKSFITKFSLAVQLDP